MYLQAFLEAIEHRSTTEFIEKVTASSLNRGLILRQLNSVPNRDCDSEDRGIGRIAVAGDGSVKHGNVGRPSMEVGGAPVIKSWYFNQS